MTLLDPGYELIGRIVTVLRANAPLQALLFPPAPLSVQDTRIYAANEELPVALRGQLPRIIVDVLEVPFDTEQDSSATPLAAASVFITVLVEANQRHLGEQLTAKCRVILGSTQWSDSHIMAAGLVPVGVSRPMRESAFRDAWRFTREYRSGLVGVMPDA